MARLIGLPRDNRGAMLVAALFTALTCGLTAYVLLMVAMSQARQAPFYQAFYQGNARARYLAEAAVVIARERLWENPAFCTSTVQVDTDNDGTGDTPVDVTVTNCGAGNDHQLRAKVNY